MILAESMILVLTLMTSAMCYLLRANHSSQQDGAF